MKKVILLIFSLLFSVDILLYSCKKIDVPPDTPACIKKEIRNQEKNSLISVTKFKYNGEYVYLFQYDQVDSYENLLDCKCNYLCAPSGGIAGTGDGKCPDFSQKAIKVGVIWTKKE